MSRAKDEVLERFTTLHNTIAQSTAVKNKTLSDVDHNNSAKMLRSGLAVVGFAALEDFIKRRSSEITRDISSAGVPFNNLPEKLQHAFTHEAIPAINYQSRLRDKADRITYVQNQASNIASTSSNSYLLPEDVFGYDQPNIQKETIKKILSSFNISDPWRAMTNVASRVGLIALPLEQSFNNAATRRHKAAHVAGIDIPETDISQFVKEGLAISIAFDSLLTRAAKEIIAHNSSFLTGRNKLSATDIKLRFIKFHSGKWKEYPEGASKAYRANKLKHIVSASALTRSQRHNEVLIELNEVGFVTNWET